MAHESVTYTDNNEVDMLFFGDSYETNNSDHELGIQY